MRGQYDRDCHRLDHSIWVAIWGQESVGTSTERRWEDRARSELRVSTAIAARGTFTGMVSHVGGLRADETAIYLNER
jgi:hypothetical protein